MSNKKRKAASAVTIDLTGAVDKTTKRRYYKPYRKRRSYAANLARWERRTFPRAHWGKMYVKRGDKTLSSFGPTWRQATDQQKQNRKDSHYIGDGLYTGPGLYTGQGGFWDSLKTGLLDAGQAAATAYNPMLGMAVGGLRKATGVGAYTTAGSNHIVNAGSGAGMNDKLPVRVQKPSETGMMCLSHTEFVSNIYAPSSSQFSKQEYLINPGLESTFKWLASIAGNYKEYELVQCIFSFKSTVSDMQTTNGVIGTINMASEYNVGNKNAIYRSKQDLMSDISAVSGKVTNGLVFGIECDPSKLKGGGATKLTKYIRTKGLRTHEDAQDFDWCRLTVATSDVPSQLFNQCLGELHVTYTVKLHRPSIQGLRGGNISQAIFSRDDRVPRVMEFSGPGGLQLDLDAKSLCKASANSIDVGIGDPVVLPGGFSALADFGSLSSSSQLAIVPIKFPAQFEGTVKVFLTLVLDKDVSVLGCEMVKTGNIQRVSDMNLGLENGFVPPSYSPNLHSCLVSKVASTGTQQPGYIVEVEAHIRINESTSGVDNQIGFQFDCPTPADGVEAKISNQMLSIVEYNADFNEEETDRPEWVNLNDGQTIVTGDGD